MENNNGLVVPSKIKKLISRVGAKDRIAPKTTPYFPLDFEYYFEPFFGGGGMYFNLDRQPRVAFLNDLDKNIANVWFVLENHRQELYDMIYSIPYDNTVFQHIEKAEPKNEIEKAAFFLIQMRYSFMGNGGTLALGQNYRKKHLLEAIESNYNYLFLDNNVQTTSVDFRVFFKKIGMQRLKDNPKNNFAYFDPPYLGTTNNYDTPKWTFQDAEDLFDLAANLGFNFAISEFDNPKILELAKKHNLYVTEICERRNLGDRRMEILITNYEPIKLANKLISQTKLF